MELQTKLKTLMEALEKRTDEALKRTMDNADGV